MKTAITAAIVAFSMYAIVAAWTIGTFNFCEPEKAAYAGECK